MLNYFSSTQTVCAVPSAKGAVAFQMPFVRPATFVLRLRCHSSPEARNWFPVVAASVGVASIAGSDVVEFVHFSSSNVCTPVDRAAPPQLVQNLKGIVLPSLKARAGSGT